NRGRPGAAAPHWRFDSEIAHARDPGEDRRRREAELRDDVNGEPGRARRLDFCRERAGELDRRDARMTFRIAGDADLADTAVLRQPALGRPHGMMERSARPRAGPAHDQQTTDP